MSIEVFQQRMVRDTAELDLEYRKSPMVGEARSSVLVSRVGAADTAEEPTTTAWWRFGNGPSPGQRAPDCTAYRADGAAVRLAELHDHRHLLLLFDGAAATADGYVRLEAVAKAVGEAFPDQVAVHIVVPDEARASSNSADRSVLVDRDGELEERYGALSECLYLVRPDLYIGFRSQPIDRSALFEHLRHLFARLVAERQ